MHLTIRHQGVYFTKTSIPTIRPTFDTSHHALSSTTPWIIMSLLQSRWAKFMKLIFIFNNFMFLLIGLAAIGFGLWGVIQGEKVFEEEWFPKIGDETMEQGEHATVV